MQGENCNFILMDLEQQKWTNVSCFCLSRFLQFNRLFAFYCKKKGNNMHDLKSREKMCMSLWFKGKGRIHMSISLETSSALDKF